MCLGLILVAFWSQKSPIFKKQILNFCDFQAQNPNFHLALELKMLKLEGSSYGKNPSIYALKGWNNETPKKVPIIVIFKEQANG